MSLKDLTQGFYSGVLTVLGFKLTIFLFHFITLVYFTVKSQMPLTSSMSRQYETWNNDYRISIAVYKWDRIQDGGSSTFYSSSTLPHDKKKNKMRREPHTFWRYRCRSFTANSLTATRIFISTLQFTSELMDRFSRYRSRLWFTSFGFIINNGYISSGFQAEHVRIKTCSSKYNILRGAWGKL